MDAHNDLAPRQAMDIDGERVTRLLASVVLLFHIISSDSGASYSIAGIHNVISAKRPKRRPPLKPRVVAPGQANSTDG